jgi:hypothetical protein
MLKLRMFFILLQVHLKRFDLPLLTPVFIVVIIIQVS